MPILTSRASTRTTGRIELLMTGIHLIYIGLAIVFGTVILICALYIARQNKRQRADRPASGQDITKDNNRRA